MRAEEAPSIVAEESRAGRGNSGAASLARTGMCSDGARGWRLAPLCRHRALKRPHVCLFLPSLSLGVMSVRSFRLSVASACLVGLVASAAMRVVAVSAAVAASAKNVAASVAHMAAEHAHKHAAAQKDEERSVFGWWDIIQHGSRAELLALLSPKWWVKYIADEFEAEPAHVIVEVICIVTIFYLLVLRKPAPVHHEKLSAKVRCSTSHTHFPPCVSARSASVHHCCLAMSSSFSFYLCCCFFLCPCWGLYCVLV